MSHRFGFGRFRNRIGGGCSKDEERRAVVFYLNRLLERTDLELNASFLNTACECLPEKVTALVPAIEELEIFKPDRLEIRSLKGDPWVWRQRKRMGQEDDDEPSIDELKAEAYQREWENFLQDDDDDKVGRVIQRLQHWPGKEPALRAALQNELRKCGCVRGEGAGKDRGTSRKAKGKDGDEAAKGLNPSLPLRFAKAKELIRTIFSLNEKEIELCELFVAINAYAPLDNLLQDELNIHRQQGRCLLASMLDVDEVELNKLLKSMAEAGLIRLDEDDGQITLCCALHQFWRTPDLKELEKQFLGPEPTQVHPIEEYRLAEDDIRHLSSMITGFKVDDPDQPPVNILLYGPPGTGKTTFAASLARHLGVRLVIPAPPEGRFDRADQLIACCSLAHSLEVKGEKVALLMDEADAFLATRDISMMFSALFGGVPPASGRSRTWLNVFMEHNQVPIIWVANGVAQMDRSLLRRFSFSLEFPEAGVEQRVHQWNYLADKSNVSQLMGSKAIRELAEGYDVPVGVMSLALDHCRKMYAGSSAEFIGGLKKSCGAFEKLCDKAMQGKAKNDVDRTPSYYDPDAVCLKGGGADVKALVRRLKNADSRMRSGDLVDAASCTMLFYGPPGTGKSALARYLSEQIGRESILIRGSDILDKYVGESEKRIRDVFQSAERDGKVLIVDEVDTFLQNREGANASWEVTRVNEFLTRLENYHGVVICTTNNLNQLDTAALRRFSSKVEFSWMAPEAVCSLYKRILAPLAGKKRRLTAEGEARLNRLAASEPGLTPGDFRTVRSVFMFEDPKDCTEERLMDALENELDVKSDGRVKKISGFAE